MLWKNELQASVFTPFSSSPKLSRVFLYLDRNTDKMFSFSLRKHCEEKRQSLVYFVYPIVNSLCSHYHYVSTFFWFGVSES